MKILSMSPILAVIAAGLFASRRESEAPLPPDFAAAIVRSDRVVAEPATALPRPSPHVARTLEDREKDSLITLQRGAQVR